MKTKIESPQVKEGDKNTKYFHSMTNHHRRINYVEEMEIGYWLVKSNE